ncbi:MAG: AraC family transcriptional regulator [Acidimicrobiia bacterium]|nr:AraC family transcriptional regulator [Acidimicrobiia bacterium]
MYEIQERMLVEQPTMVVRGTIKLEDIPTFLGRAYHMVDSQIRDSGAHVVGEPFARYRCLDGEYREFEVEAGVPVVLAVSGHGGVEASVLPAGPAAVTVHTGPYERMEPAYDALNAWLDEHGGNADGPAWEVYHTDPNAQPDPATWRTEIVQPYKEVPRS